MNVVWSLVGCVFVKLDGCRSGTKSSQDLVAQSRSLAQSYRMSPPMGAAPSHVPPTTPDLPSPTHTPSLTVRERKRLKVGGFATLRKKLMRRRRGSKACDHGRVMREAVSDWSGHELAALLDEYESLAALKDLSVQAELARPPAPTFKQDLSTLYDFKYCTDVDLVFRGACFPVHRAILSARCSYFRDLLQGCPGYGARICLELRTSGVDVEMFSALLRYLYTGDFGGVSSGHLDMTTLRRLGDEFGHPHPLEHDLKYLLETGDFADAALVFTSEHQAGVDQRPESGCSEYGFRPKLELPCHKAILSARSPFFRNLIQRRTRSGEEHTERALHIPARIVLDESVIPKRYAKVLLHAIYLDTVDLTLIMRGNGANSTGSLGEAEALTCNGRTRPTPLEEAMELYQIGRFLELDIVSQGCEDIIIEWLTIESLPGVLRWGSEGHGSGWVLRQATHLLREEFAQISHSPVLFQLDKEHLVHTLASHFLQASELDVLQAVLKWGEHRLVRRMEDREPNVVSQTAHSVTRKGVKKRDLSDVELREILSELLPLVRMDHVIPQDCEPLSQAIRRGLVSNPPSHMIGSDQRGAERINAWVRASHLSQHSGLFVRPRLFMPYYEEIKSLVEEGLVNEGDGVRIRRARYMHDIPDTLYMVDEKPPRPTPSLDVIAQAIPAPDAATMSSMLKRECKLRQSTTCQRAIALPLSSKIEINRQIRLRVVREFNLPDQVASLLENASCYHMEEEEDNGCIESVGTGGGVQMSGPLNRVEGFASIAGGGGRRTRRLTRRTRPSPQPAPHPPLPHPLLPAVVTEGTPDPAHNTFPRQWLVVNEREGLMPDVTMATASLDQLTLGQGVEVSGGEEEGLVEGLDLGDGGVLPRRPRLHLPHLPPPPPPPPHRFI